MHKKRISIILIIVVAIILVITFISRHHSPEKESKPDNYNLLSNNDISKAKTGDFTNTLYFTGELIPKNQTTLSSEVTATVKKIEVAEGQFVHKGQVLAILDDTALQEDVRAQNAMLSAKEATFGLDQKKLNQQKELFEQGFISKIAYTELQTNYQGSLEAINQSRANLVQAQKKLSDAIIRAPFSGYVYKKYIDNGQLVSPNSKIFALANLNQMQIKAPIPSEQINQIKINSKVTFNVETSSDTYSGKVTLINPVAIENTRSFYVYIDFNNEKQHLKSGQFVKGQIVIATIPHAVYILNDTIRTSNDESKYVYILENNKVISKPIKVLLKNTLTNNTAVSGVEAQDTLISNSIVNLKPGDLAKFIN